VNHFALLVLITALTPQQDTTLHNSTSPEQVILEVRVGSIASVIVPARRLADTALLPVSAVFSLAGLPAAAPDTLYAPSATLESMLHAHISVDWESLTITIEDDGTLPVSRRARREEARKAFNLEDSFEHPSDVREHETGVMPRDMIIDYHVASDPVASLAPSTVQLGVGASVLRGDLSLDFYRARSLPRVNYAASWERDTPSRPWLAHIQVGQTLLRDAMVPVYGFDLSSHSSLVAELAPSIALSGAAADGADIRVLRNGSLVYDGIADAAATQIPTVRGVNTVAMSIFDTLGNEHITRRYVLIDENALPARTGSYDLTVGRCAESRCQYGAQITTKFAPTSRVTTGASGTVLDIGRDVAAVSRFLLITHLRDDLNATVNLGGGDAFLRLRFVPSPDLDVSMIHGRTSTQRQGGAAMLRHSGTSASVSWHRDPGYTASAAVDLSGLDFAEQRRLRFTASAAFGGNYLRPFADISRARGTSAIAEYGIHGESSLRLLDAGVRVRGGASTAATGNRFIGISFPFARSAWFDGRVDWTGMHVPRIELSINVVSRVARHETRVVASRKAAISTSSISGSIAVSGAHHEVALSPQQSRGRAQIAGRVYVDADCDGRLSAADRLLPGVSVSIRGRLVESDSLGEYRIPDVAPFVAVVLVVDSLSLPSGDLYAQPMRVVPLPNGITEIDLQVTATNSSGGLVCRGGSVSRLPEDTQGSNSTPIHRNYFETGLRDPDTVADTRKPSESREDVASKRGPVAVGNIKRVIGTRINE